MVDPYTVYLYSYKEVFSVKKFVIIVLAVVAVIIGGAILKHEKPSTISSPTNNTLGKGTSGVTLTMYADFECPGCGAFYPILKQVTDHYKDEIKFQFINFPLTQIHQNALAAARAAQAANDQGKFWEMHDLLYANQTTWAQLGDATSTFEGYATQIGLNMPKYRTDYASAATNATINADIASGQAKQVTGTPTFFLDGKQIEDNNTVSTPAKFEAVIDAEILAKTGKPATASATPAATPTTVDTTTAPTTN